MQFDFTMAGYGSQNIETAGRFVKYVNGTGKIRVRFDKGGYIDLLPGQGCTGLDFSRLTIEDRSGAGNVGVLLAGAFMFQDDRISGTVDVVDGGRLRTLSGQSFLVAGGCLAYAGTYSCWQIWNPPGSGKRVAVGGYSMTGATAGAVSILSASGAAANAGNQSASKLIKDTGAPGSGAALMRYENRANLANVGAEMALDFVNIQASSSYTRTLKEPILLMPGSGLLMRYEVVNATINGTWEWTEEAVQ